MTATTGLAATWWGHATTTLEMGGETGGETGSTRVLIDPLLTDRLLHLRRYAAPVTEAATRADLVLVSHLHLDHCHLPSLRRVARDVPLVVPAGAEPLLRSLGPDRLVPVAPGDRLEVAGVGLQVLPASHDGRRWPGARTAPPALGFRLTLADASVWYPGDTGLREDFADVDPVDMAVVPVGGWGPSLGPEHIDPEQAAEAVRRVGAAAALPVHWGTFWPQGFRALDRATHHHLFVTPGERFAAAAADVTRVLRAWQGERVVVR